MLNLQPYRTKITRILHCHHYSYLSLLIILPTSFYFPQCPSSMGAVTKLVLKETHHAFIHFSSYLQCFIEVCVHVKHLKMSKSTPTEALPSHTDNTAPEVSGVGHSTL